LALASAFPIIAVLSFGLYKKAIQSRSIDNHQNEENHG
jgi:hypothetical protein